MKIPQIVGVLNLSPESLNNRVPRTDKIGLIERVRKMVDAGADILDIGAQSSRPNITELSLDEEHVRLKGKIAIIRKAFPSLRISVDTTRHEIALLALDEGATIVNDISGGRFDSTLLEEVARHEVDYVLMHSQGSFSLMHVSYHYYNIVKEIKDYFTERIDISLKAGIKKEKIILDPGIGFSKNRAQNLEILRKLGEFQELGFPLYIGLSRKRFVGSIISEENSEKRDNATSVFHTLCIQQGVDYIRTHNVKYLKECVQVLSSF